MPLTTPTQESVVESNRSPEPRPSSCRATEATLSSAERALLLAVQRELCRAAHPRLFRLDVRVDGSDVELRGRVPSYYLKQLAQASVLRLQGVVGVRNEIEVVD